MLCSQIVRLPPKYIFLNLAKYHFFFIFISFCVFHKTDGSIHEETPRWVILISSLTVSSMDWIPLYKVYSCGLGAALAVGTDDTLNALIPHMDHET